MKILLLAYENDANVSASLANKFLSLGHEVEIFICDFFSATIAKEYVRKILIKNGIDEKIIFDFKNELKYINNIKNFDDDIDYEFLSNLENSFVGNRTLSELIHADFIMSASNHNRSYISIPNNQNVVIKLAEILSKKMSNKLNAFLPDIIFTNGNHHFAKNVFYELSQSLEIEYLALDTSRINNRFILLDNFWIGTSKYIKLDMDKLKNTNNPCLDAKKYINSLKNKHKQAYSLGSYDDDNDKRYNFWYQIIPILKGLKSIPRAYLNERRDEKERDINNNWFSPISMFNVLFYNFRAVFRIRKYFKNKALNQALFPKEPYILMTLHMVPENNIFTDPDYIDEKALIIMISKIIPINYKIVIKANPSMFTKFADTHPPEFYEDISKIHNVIFISPKIKSMPYIAKAKAVVTISGTSLMEAALLGIPAFAYGSPEFNILDGVYKFDKNNFMKTIKKHKYSTENNHKYYIQAMINNSVELDFFKYYMSDEKTTKTKKFKTDYLDRLSLLIINTYKNITQN